MTRVVFLVEPIVKVGAYLDLVKKDLLAFSALVETMVYLDKPIM